MRFFVSTLSMVCCALVGYAQESGEAPSEETAASGGDVVVVPVDAPVDQKCGCTGKPKL